MHCFFVFAFNYFDPILVTSKKYFICQRIYLQPLNRSLIDEQFLGYKK